MLTRSLSQAVTTPELTMAHRLLYDDASLRITRGVPEAIDLAEDLPVFVRDRQETRFVQQGEDNVYLCGSAVSIDKVAPMTND